MEKKAFLVFLGGSVVKNPSANAEDTGLIPDPRGVAARVQEGGEEPLHIQGQEGQQ